MDKKTELNNLANRQRTRLLGFVAPVSLALVSFMASADHSHSSSQIHQSIEQAIEKRQQGLVYDSIDILAELKSHHQDHVRIYLELAVSYLKAQQYQLADAQVKELVSANPVMKSHERIQKLQEMISIAKQKALDSQHQFKGEITGYRGSDELTAKFPYFEITEFEDFYQVERKEESFESKHHYVATRLKGEYRYTPTQSFNLFGQPTYSFWNNRITHFQKHSLGDKNDYFGFTSFDSSYFLMQPKRWALNAKVKAKWHTYHGQRSLTEKSIDVNGSVLFWGARFKLGVHRTTAELDKDYAEDLFGDTGVLFEQKNSIVSPYLSLSYRFSPSLLWTVGSRRRSIHATRAELEGTVINYNTTLKYQVNESFSLHSSFYYDDLDYQVVDLDFGLHSGELKKTLIIGAAYRFNDNWQFGLNSLYMDRKQKDDYGQDQWKRFEAFVRYNF